MKYSLYGKGSNDINTTFKAISKEKETQYQYLQKILELVDTGILSYQEESGEIVWMNESLKTDAANCLTSKRSIPLHGATKNYIKKSWP
ncbi:MAG: hypothetical protein WDO19_27965 [Bacteroidota bacterium]